MKKISNAVLVVALSLLAAGHILAQQWSQGDPSAQEQYAVVQINTFRANPAGYQAHYINLYASDPIVAGLIYYFYAPTQASLPPAAVYSASDAATTWIVGHANTASAMPPLAIYPLFSQQAALSREAPTIMVNPSTTSFFGFGLSQFTLGYTSPAAYNPPTSIAPVPDNEYYPVISGGTMTGSNATGGTATASLLANTVNYFVINGLLYDTSFVGPREWGLSNFHSISTYTGNPNGTFPETYVVPGSHLRMLGVNLAQRTASPGSGQTYLSTFYLDNERLTTSDLPYGAANTCFVTGVAYVDQNNNGEYDPGEGVSGLKVSINGSSWYAVTVTAGGYSIPVQVGAGTITVTATGTVSGATVTTTKTVTIAGDNVEVDFPYPSVRPPQVAVPAASGTCQIINLSTRGITSPGAGVMTGGFVIGGSATAQKKVLIRGVAATLAQYLYPASISTLIKPLLTIYNGSGTVIATRSTQQTAADTTLSAVFAQVGAFPFVNSYGGTAAGDTAIVMTLGPGAYTFTISQAPDTPAGDAGFANYSTGAVLAEVYDVSKTDGARLINISTRGTVPDPSLHQTPIIAGVVITGTGTERLLLRTVGPTLGTFGVSGVISNPALTFDNSAGTAIISDQGWDYGAQGAQIAALERQTGAFALTDPSLDSAAIVLVPPGSYTLPVAAGKYATSNSGIVLVEIYEANSP